MEPPSGPISRTDAVVVGGGPAGLRAAEVLAENGARVALFEQKPSVGRKFLVAGRGGLNLTHSEDLTNFAARYGEPSARWRELLEAFPPTQLRAWAAGLGIETYIGTSGRVFPRGQQAAGLLRRWVARLRTLGVEFHVNRRWIGLRALGPEVDGGGSGGSGWQLDFADARVPAGALSDMHAGEAPRDASALEAPADAGEVAAPPESVACGVVVLALGGASWPQTGSDGRWPALLREATARRAKAVPGQAAAGAVEVAPWQAANCGWEVAWDPRLLAAAEGLPLKNLAVRADDGEPWVAGEALITRYGLEGGTLYQLGARLRATSAISEPRKPRLGAMGNGPRLIFDFKPSATADQLLRKLPRQGVGTVELAEAAARWRLGAGARALLEFHGPGARSEGAVLAAAVKGFALALQGPRPIEEAISSAGGVRWAELDHSLMLRRLPGVFLAGEMIDWEAPTGGYLLQGCFATGTRAGRGAAGVPPVTVHSQCGLWERDKDPKAGAS